MAIVAEDLNVPGTGTGNSDDPLLTTDDRIGGDNLPAQPSRLQAFADALLSSTSLGLNPEDFRLTPPQVPAVGGRADLSRITFPTTRTETPDTPGWGAFDAGMESLAARFTGIGMGIDALQGDQAEFDQLAARNDERYAEMNRLMGDQPRFWDDPGEYILQLAGLSLPETGAVLAGSAAGAAVGAGAGLAFFGVGAAPGALIGSFVGGAATAIPLFFGGNIERQRQEGASMEDLNLGAAAGAAVVQGTADALLGRFLLGVGGRMVGTAARAGLRTGATATGAAAEQAAARGFWRGLGVSAVEGAALEGTTEGLQQALERLQAGLSVTDAEAVSEIAEAGFGGALLGTLFSGGAHTMGAAFRPREPKQTDIQAGDPAAQDTPATANARLSLSEYAAMQVARIEEQDAQNWQQPNYRGDPRVPQALAFWNYVGTAEDTVQRISNLPPDQRNRPENIAALSEAQNVLDLMETLRNPQKVAQGNQWVLDVGDKPTVLALGEDGRPVYRQNGTVLETDANGFPVTKGKGPVWVRTAAGKDVRVTAADIQTNVKNVTDVMRGNILLSPKTQEQVRAVMQKALAAARGVYDAATTRSTTLALPRPGDRLVSFRDGVQGDLFASLPEQTDPNARPDASADPQQGDLFNQPGMPDPNQTELDVTVTNPTQERATAGTRATLNAAQSLNSRVLAAQASNTARPLPRAIPTDQLPGDLIQRMRMRAVQTGQDVPTTITPKALRETAEAFGLDPDAVEAATKDILFRRAEATQMSGGVDAPARPARRGVDGILSMVPAGERAAVARVLRVFQRIIGRPLNEIDVIDLAEWASRTNKQLSPEDAAAYLPRWLGKTAEGLERGAIALASGRDTTNDVRNVAHELTHMLLRLVGFDPVSMARLYDAIPDTHPIKAYIENDRHYASLEKWERAEEFFAFSVEEAMTRRAGRGSNADKTFGMLREFMSRMVEFVRGVFDALVGRDVVTDTLLGIQQAYGVSVFTGMRATHDLPISTLKRLAKNGLAEEGDTEADPNGLLRREVRAAARDRGQDAPITPEQQRDIVQSIMATLPDDLVNTFDAVRNLETGRMVGLLQTEPTRDAMQMLFADLVKLTNEGRAGRMWYERSGQAVLDFVGGSGAKGRNNSAEVKRLADKMAQLIAVYSPREQVSGNTHKAMTAWARWRAGQPVWSGREVTKQPLVDRVIGEFGAEKEARDLHRSVGGNGAGYEVVKQGRKWIVRQPALQQARAMAKRLNEMRDEKHNAVEYELPDGSAAAAVIVTDETHDNIGFTAQDFIAHQLLYRDRAFAGRKVNNFWRNLSRQWTNEEQGVTVDMWMTRAFGYVDMMSVSANRFRLIEEMSKAIGARIGWEPQQVQAAIWTAIKARYELVNKEVTADAQRSGIAENVNGMVRAVAGKEGIYALAQRQRAMMTPDTDEKLVARTNESAVRDFSDFMSNNVAQISWESAPSTSAGHIKGYEKTSDENKLTHHTRIKAAMEDAQGRDILIRDAGLLNPGNVSGPTGYYAGDINPVTQDLVGATRTKGRPIGVDERNMIKREQIVDVDAATRSLIEAVAAARALVLVQDQIGWHRPFFTGPVKDHTGIEVSLGRRLTQDDVSGMADNLRAVLRGAGMEGLAESMALVATKGGVRALNFSGGRTVGAFRTSEDAEARAAELQPYVVGDKGAYTVIAPAADVEAGPFATKSDASRFAKKFHRTRVVRRVGDYDASSGATAPDTYSVVYEAMPNTTFHDMVKAAASQLGLKADVSTFASAGDLVGKDWTDAEAQINTLIDTVVASGRSDLLETARVLRERVAVVERASARDFGWTYDEALGRRIEERLDGVLAELAGRGVRGDGERADAAAGEGRSGVTADVDPLDASVTGDDEILFARRPFDTKPLPMVELVTDENGRRVPKNPLDNIARGRAAFNRVLNGAHDIKNAMWVPAVQQYISFVYGNETAGAHHAQRKRPGNKPSEQAAVDAILKTLTYGKPAGKPYLVNGSLTARVNLQYQNFVVPVGLTNAGNPEARTWLITGFEADHVKGYAKDPVILSYEGLDTLIRGNDGNIKKLERLASEVAGGDGWVPKAKLEELRLQGKGRSARKIGDVGDVANYRVPGIFRRIENGVNVDGSAPQAGSGELSGRGDLPAGSDLLVAQRGSDDPAAPGFSSKTRLADNADLAGLPKRVAIPALGTTVEASAFPTARRLAREYAASAGIDYTPPSAYVQVDVERATRIADAYEEMKHDPKHPVVRAAYEAMAAETMAQWRMIKATGLQVSFSTNPYPESPRLAAEDVRNNNHMDVFPTDEGYGESPITEEDIAENPLLAQSGEVIDGKPACINDIFRIVHDYFGHVKDGVGFRAAGEENAWRSHAAMYSPLARMAMTSETRGQNSWLNYGPYGETNRTAMIGDTVFAEQKIGLLPDWVMSEGTEDFLAPVDYAAIRREAGSEVSLTEGFAEDDAHPFSAAEEEIPTGAEMVQLRDEFLSALDAPKFRRAPNPDVVNSAPFKAWFKDSAVVNPDTGEPLILYHGTKADFDVFAKGDVGYHFGSMGAATQRVGYDFDARLALAEGNDAYFADPNMLSNYGITGRNIMPVYLSIQKPLDMRDVGAWDSATDWMHRLQGMNADNPKEPSALTMDDPAFFRRLWDFIVPLSYEQDRIDSRGDVNALTDWQQTVFVPKLKKFLTDEGYDGIKYWNEYEGTYNLDNEAEFDHFSWIVFDPGQVKSATGNAGSFDANNPDIRFRRGIGPVFNTARQSSGKGSNLPDWWLKYLSHDFLNTSTYGAIIASGRGTKAARRLANLLSRSRYAVGADEAPGGVLPEGYHGAVEGGMGRFAAPLVRALKPIAGKSWDKARKSKANRKMLAKALRGGLKRDANGNVDYSGTEVNQQIVDNVRKVLDDLYIYLVEAMKAGGAKASEIPQKLNNYFPQLWRMEGKFEEGPLAGLDRRAVLQAWFKTAGVFGGDPNQDAAISEMLDRMSGQDGAVSYGFSIEDALESRISARFYGEFERILRFPGDTAYTIKVGGKDVRVELTDLLDNDAYRVLNQHVVRTVRRAEFVRRFGMHGEVFNQHLADMDKELVASGASPLTVQEKTAIRRAVQANFGLLGADFRVIHPFWMKTMSAMRLFTDVAVLSLSSIASVPEFAMPSVRFGLRGQMSALQNNLATLFRTQGAKDIRHFAEDLGIIGQTIHHALMEQVEENSPFLMEKVRNEFFKWNLLQPITNIQRAGATAAAIQSIRRWGDKAAAGDAQHIRFLKEVGLTPDMVATFDPDNYAATATPQIKAAIRQMVDETIIAPNPSQRPAWHSDPRFMLLAQIKGWFAAFNNTVLQRVGREVTYGNFRPLMYLMGYAALSAMVYTLREQIRWGDEGNPFMGRTLESIGMEDTPEARFVYQMIERGGLLGPAQMLSDMMIGSRIGREPNIGATLSPFVGLAETFIQGSADVIFALDDKQFRRGLDRMTRVVPLVNMMGQQRQDLITFLTGTPQPGHGSERGSLFKIKLDGFNLDPIKVGG